VESWRREITFECMNRESVEKGRDKENVAKMDFPMRTTINSQSSVPQQLRGSTWRDVFLALADLDGEVKAAV